MNATPEDRIRLRLKLTADILMGPGKADVLRAIRDTGSISAAGRRYGMSYKRTWDLVNAMNHEYKRPLVQTSTGGQRGGGATLTPMGEQVLAIYERIIALTTKAISREFSQLERLASRNAASR
jgi:molybdate transport system regulatory protein